METVPTPRKKGQRSWTDAQRAEQGRRTRERQIWLKSTGPKTPKGRQISSRNSYKHGRFSYERKIIGWYVRLAVMRNKQIKTRLAYENQKRENELRDKYGFPHPPRPDVMAYYPYFKHHPTSPEARAEARKQKNAKRKPKKSNHLHEVFDYFTKLGEEWEKELHKGRIE